MRLFIWLILFSLSFNLLHSQYQYDETTQKALALLQSQNDDKKDDDNTKDQKDDDAGDNENGGEDAGDPESSEDDPLTQISLMEMLQELSETIMANKEIQSQAIIDKVLEIQEETKHFIEKITEYFSAHNQNALYEIKEKLFSLRDLIQKNYKAMFLLAEVLTTKIKDKKEEEIHQLKYNIRALLMNFPPPLSSCELLEGCDACLSRKKCIWCTDVQKCHEGDFEDGVFFFQCAFTLLDSCISPRSDLFFELQPEPVYESPLTNYFQLPDMPLYQKKYISKKQNEMISMKNKIDLKRYQLISLHNVTVMIRAKRIALSFQMARIQKLKDLGLSHEDDVDDDYQGRFLDGITIEGDFGDAIAKLEAEVMLMKEQDEERQELEEQRQQEAEERRQDPVITGQYFF